MTQMDTSVDGPRSELDPLLRERLDAFLPRRVFDAHAHFYDAGFLPTIHGSDMFDLPRAGATEHRHFLESLFPRLEEVRATVVTMPDPAMADRSTGLRDASLRFLTEQLEGSELLVGEALVLPDDTVDDVEALLTHPRVRGFKCYHFLAEARPTWEAGIGDYLPESAWQVAHEHGLAITLHVVRGRALADAGNLAHIEEMARRYPRANLVLAHAGRGFAAWTAVEGAARLAPLDNVWFDLSAVCESPPVIALLRRFGPERLVWGSDYPVSSVRGKAISLGDGFYWIYERDLERFEAPTPVRPTLVGMENLLAVHQACAVLDVARADVEAIFHGNAMRLFGLGG